MNKLRVLLADDHGVVREGLKALINGQQDMEVVGEAADGRQAVDRAAAVDPDVVVTDVSMPGLGGADVTRQLLAASPGRKVIALSVHEEEGYVRQLRDAGAAGYVLKRGMADDIVAAIRTVAAGGSVHPPVDRPPVTPPPAAAGDLSERETEVVKGIAQGYSNKELAARLAISVKTVETYKSRSLEKLGLRSRTDIVRYAVRRGWLTDAG